MLKQSMFALTLFAVISGSFIACTVAPPTLSGPGARIYACKNLRQQAEASGVNCNEVLGTLDASTPETPATEPTPEPTKEATPEPSTPKVTLAFTKGDKNTRIFNSYVTSKLRSPRWNRENKLPTFTEDQLPVFIIVSVKYQVGTNKDLKFFQYKLTSSGKNTLQVKAFCPVLHKSPQSASTQREELEHFLFGKNREKYKATSENGPVVPNNGKFLPNNPEKDLDDTIIFEISLAPTK